MYSRLRLPEIADGTMPEHIAPAPTLDDAFILSAFIPRTDILSAFALGARS